MATDIPVYSSRSGESLQSRLHYLVDHCSLALHDEIVERKPLPHHDSPTFPLKRGLRQHRTGRTSYFLFDTDPLPPHVLDHANASLILGANRYTCRIVGFSLDGLALAIEADLPEVIDDAQLTLETPRLLEALVKRLQDVLKHPQMFDIARGLHACDPHATPKPLSVLAVPPAPQLNPEQYTAYETALRQDLTYVIGPPGTGKTDLIATLVLALHEMGQRTLLCSPTNTAIDLIIDTILDKRPTLPTGDLLRVGSPSPDSSDRAQMVNLEALTLAANFHLEETIARLKRHLTDLDTDLETARAFLDTVTQHQPAIEALQSAHQTVEQLTRSTTVLQHTLDERHLVLRDLMTQIMHQQTMPAVFRLFQQPSRETLLEQHFTLAHRQQQDQDALATLTTSLTAAQTALAHHQATVQQATPVITWDTTVWTAAELTALLATLTHSRTTLLQALHQQEQQLRLTEQDFVSNSRIIGTTLTRTYTSRLLHDQRYDTVIIEEASMGAFPAILHAACLSKSRVIIVGDFLQLPPISTAKTPAARQWLGRSIYQIAHVQSGDDPRIVALNTQYRMHPTIAAVASRLYAKAGLDYHSAPGMAARRAPITDLAPAPGSALIFVDTQDGHPTTLRDHTGSPYNIYHALLCVELAQQMLSTPGPHPSITIVAPYCAQVKLLDRMLRHEGLEKQVRIGTIHQFQGSASDVLIFDTVLTENVSRSMLGSTSPDAHPHLLINVAITRAKGKLFLIGHGDALSSLARHPDPILWDCVQQAHTRGTVIPALSLVPALTCQVGQSILHSTDSLLTVLPPRPRTAPLLHAV
ncbi:MAG: AAA domain-containing protein [Nitrospira sp.]